MYSSSTPADQAGSADDGKTIALLARTNNFETDDPTGLDWEERRDLAVEIAQTLKPAWRGAVTIYDLPALGPEILPPDLRAVLCSAGNRYFVGSCAVPILPAYEHHDVEQAEVEKAAASVTGDSLDVTIKTGDRFVPVWIKLIEHHNPEASIFDMDRSGGAAERCVQRGREMETAQ